MNPKLVPEDEVTQPLRQVVRVASAADLTQVDANRHEERDAFVYAQEKIQHLGLEMKLVDVEYAFDKSKLVFCFAAEKRVDFRELVKELAARFRTRIELRQIGVRDEAKLLGGLGVCGQCLCCTSWIGDFAPVSIRHAKEQELSMNPNKISGLCGRLKCCLRFEAEAYEDAHCRQPRIGSVVRACTSEARVVSIDLLRERVTVELTEGTRVTMGWDELKAGGPSLEQVQENAVPRAPRLCNAELGSTKEKTAIDRKESSKAANGQKGSAQGPSKASQELAAGTDSTQKPTRKRRRSRRRKPRRQSRQGGAPTQ